MTDIGTGGYQTASFHTQSVATPTQSIVGRALSSNSGQVSSCAMPVFSGYAAPVAAPSYPNYPVQGFGIAECRQFLQQQSRQIGQATSPSFQALQPNYSQSSSKVATPFAQASASDVVREFVQALTQSGVNSSQYEQLMTSMAASADANAALLVLSQYTQSLQASNPAWANFFSAVLDKLPASVMQTSQQAIPMTPAQKNVQPSFVHVRQAIASAPASIPVTSTPTSQSLTSWFIAQGAAKRLANGARGNILSQMQAAKTPQDALQTLHNWLTNVKAAPYRRAIDNGEDLTPQLLTLHQQLSTMLSNGTSAATSTLQAQAASSAFSTQAAASSALWQQPANASLPINSVIPNLTNSNARGFPKLDTRDGGDATVWPNYFRSQNLPTFGVRGRGTNYDTSIASRPDTQLGGGTNVLMFYRDHETPGSSLFGNFEYCPNGVTVDFGGSRLAFHNAECAFQAAKVDLLFQKGCIDQATAINLMTRLQQAPTGENAWSMIDNEINDAYRKAPGNVKADWNATKEQIMLAVVTAKFSQNPTFAAALISQEGKTLIENSGDAPGDWSINVQKGQLTGRNFLGSALMQAMQSPAVRAAASQSPISPNQFNPHYRPLVANQSTSNPSTSGQPVYVQQSGQPAYQQQAYAQEPTQPTYQQQPAQQSYNQQVYQQPAYQQQAPSYQQSTYTQQPAQQNTSPPPSAQPAYTSVATQPFVQPSFTQLAPTQAQATPPIPERAEDNKPIQSPMATRQGAALGLGSKPTYPHLLPGSGYYAGPPTPLVGTRTSPTTTQVPLSNGIQLTLNSNVNGIFDENVQVVVNAAQQALSPYMGNNPQGIQGLNRAMYEKRGDGYRQAYDRFHDDCRCDESGGGFPTGAAALLPGGVIMAAGPDMRGKNTYTAEDQNNLYRCYYNSLALAASQGVTSIAFPAISTAIYAFDKKLAADIAIRAAQDFSQAQGAGCSLKKIVFLQASQGSAVSTNG